MDQLVFVVAVMLGIVVFISTARIVADNILAALRGIDVIEEQPPITVNFDPFIESLNHALINRRVPFYQPRKVKYTEDGTQLAKVIDDLAANDDMRERFLLELSRRLPDEKSKNTLWTIGDDGELVEVEQ